MTSTLLPIKVTFFGEKFQLQGPLVQDIATRPVQSEYTSHTPGSFLEFNPSPGRSFKEFEI